jgi:hypothetical protein
VRVFVNAFLQGFGTMCGVDSFSDDGFRYFVGKNFSAHSRDKGSMVAAVAIGAMFLYGAIKLSEV